MARTLGYHWVKSCHGLWLPGDDRGSWSEAWDAELGFIEPHMLHEGDPVRKRMAEERMKHPPMRLTDAMIEIVAQAIGDCVARSNGGLAVAKLLWSYPGQAQQVVPSNRLSVTTAALSASAAPPAVHSFGIEKWLAAADDFFAFRDADAGRSPAPPSPSPSVSSSCGSQAGAWSRSPSSSGS